MGTVAGSAHEIRKIIEKTCGSETSYERARIIDNSGSPVMGTPGLAFWGGATLVAAAYDLGKANG